MGLKKYIRDVGLNKVRHEGLKKHTRHVDLKQKKKLVGFFFGHDLSKWAGHLWACAVGSTRPKKKKKIGHDTTRPVHLVGRAVLAHEL